MNTIISYMILTFFLLIIATIINSIFEAKVEPIGRKSTGSYKPV